MSDDPPDNNINPCTDMASKFAVRAINQGAAIELGKYGITANVYCPTVVTTDMWKTIDQEISAKNGWTAGEYTDNVRLQFRKR